jgi:hypothetical protein
MRLTFCLLVLAVSATAEMRDFVRVSPRNPKYMELTSGKSYIPIGLNLIAPPRAANEDEALQRYDAWLAALAGNGGNYVRVWISNDFFDVEHARSGEYDEAKARRIERMLALAKACGIRVKMTIEHFRSIGGGPQAWADKPLHSVAQGGPAASIADFFDGPAPRAQFQKKIAWLGQRFGARPEVYGWELWNEINAVRGGDYMAWTAAMLPALHQAFPRNLAMQSLGSFDTDRVRETYRRHSLLAGNDIAQVHRYLDLGAQLEVCHGPMDVLAAEAVRELIAFQPGRPVVLAESGAVEPRHSGPFKLYAVDKAGILLHDVLFAPFFAGAAGAGQIWHWDAYVAANNLWHHFGRFAEAVRGIDPAAEDFAPSMIEHPRLRIYQLKGRRTTLLWLRDKENTWITELKEGQAPQPVRGVTLPFKNARFYDPWTNRWSKAKASGGQVAVPEFTRSLVAVIK